MSIKTSVTFSPAKHQANPFSDVSRNRTKNKAPPMSLLESACPDQHKKMEELLQTSFQDLDKGDSYTLPRRNGFVHTVVDCYNHHGALVLRPDDGKLKGSNFIFARSLTMLRSVARYPHAIQLLCQRQCRGPEKAICGARRTKASDHCRGMIAAHLTTIRLIFAQCC